MIPYTIRTGTLATLAKLKRAGWALMVTPSDLRTHGMRYALDNGAWQAHLTGQAFGADQFVRAYETIGAQADFIVLPDIVAGGLPSLAFSLSWRERLRGARRPLLLAVQDGMQDHDVAALVGPDLGIFVGGSTSWKETSMQMWGKLARARRAYLHVGRVNTIRRINLCLAAGAHSFDGSSPVRYTITLGKLDNARRQMDWTACC